MGNSVMHMGGEDILSLLTADLSKYHTVYLLSVLREEVQRGIRQCYDEEYNDILDLNKSQLKEVESRLKSELATREHVPNKEERKKARIIKMKLKQNR